MTASKRVPSTIAVLSLLLILAASALHGGERLEQYGEGARLFERIDIADTITVYFHQRMIGEAIVEKDYIVYQFGKAGGELLERKSHWREELPDTLPPVRIGAEHLQSLFEEKIQSATLFIISPESDVFPITPCPKNPCWIVRSIRGGAVVVTIVDAVDGAVLGNGVPPPYTGFSLTGPIYYSPCLDAWTSWSLSAANWFETMGYSTQEITWPTEEEVRGHIESSETAMFYELAHGGSYSFSSGCAGGQQGEYTTAAEITSWISAYEKIPFAFIGSCDGLCATGSGTLSYAFRKGSMERTATIGYCGMSGEACATCWTYSLDWQNALFSYMDLEYSVKDAFDLANADYPVCAIASCMRFAGDEEFAVVPIVERTPGTCSIVPPSIDFDSVAVGCFKDTTFSITNISAATISGDISEACGQYSVIAGAGPFSLDPEQTIVVTVRFEPASIGALECTIETGLSGCSDVPCDGVGRIGCTLEPAVLGFGSIEMFASEDLSFTLTNNYCDTLRGAVSESCDHFSIVSGGGAYTLPCGENRVVVVRFTPTALGSHSCTIETGDAVCDDMFCTGYALEPPAMCSIEPDTLDYGAVPIGFDSTASFTITNTGYQTLTGSVSESCPNHIIVSGKGSYALTHGQVRTVTVVFFPDAAGQYPCTVETGSALCSDVVCIGTGDDLTGIEAAQPIAFDLYQNYPNPFESATRIRFSLDREGRAALRIFDISGKHVRTLANRAMAPGVYTEEWDGRDSAGNTVASGIYFYQLKMGARIVTRKAVLLN